MTSTSLYMYCCTSSLVLCSTCCLVNVLLRSAAVCVIRRWNSNGKYMAKNLIFVQCMEHFCWVGYVNQLGKYDTVYLITFQTLWIETLLA